MIPFLRSGAVYWCVAFVGCVAGRNASFSPFRASCDQFRDASTSSLPACCGLLRRCKAGLSPPSRTCVPMDPLYPPLIGRLPLYCMSAFVRSGATDILALDPTILLQWPSAAAAVVSSSSLLHRQVVSQPHAGRGSSCTSDVWFLGGGLGGEAGFRRFAGFWAWGSKLGRGPHARRD